MERGIIFNIKGNLASVAQDFDKVTLITGGSKGIGDGSWLARGSGVARER